MQLFKTDASFELAGLPRPGVPFLCGSDMELVGPPNDYLMYIATVRGRTRSPNTWATYGDNLFDFFDFLEANGFHWDSVNDTHVATWRDAMLARGNKRKTVNQRIRLVYAFYRWASHRGYAHTLPFLKQDVWAKRPEQFLAHIDASGGHVNAWDLTVREDATLPVFLRLEEALAFVEALPNRLSKLMAYLALTAGLRREEVTCLDHRVLPNPAGRDSSKQLRMHLDANVTPTKRSKSRMVMLPYDLGVALSSYFDREWTKRLKKYERAHGEETTRLFLSEYGEPFSIKYLNNLFLQVSKRTGIKCHPHMLRGTFATYELLRMSAKHGQMKALHWVRDRMGHSSIKTTELYIDAAALVVNDDVDGYQAQICEALRNGC